MIEAWSQALGERGGEAAKHRGELPVNERATASKASATTDSQGRFRLDHLHPGEYFVVATDGVSPLSGVTRARAGERGVRLRVDEPAKFSGRVLSPDGSPVRRFRIGDRNIDSSDGSFALSPRRTGKHTLRFSLEGFVPAVRVVTFEQGGTLQLPDVVLSRPRALSGRVLDAATKRPLARVRVTATSREVPMDEDPFVVGTRVVETNSDGVFALDEVEAACRLFLERNGYATAVDATSDSTDLVIESSPSAE